jgi:hypothetical protein
MGWNIFFKSKSVHAYCFHVHIFLETLVNVMPIQIQGRHGRFLAGKAVIVALLLLPAVFYFSKSSHGPGFGGLASCGGPVICIEEA